MNLDKLYKYEEDKTKADLTIEFRILKLELTKNEKKQKTTGEGESKETKYWYNYYYEMPTTVKITFNKYRYEYRTDFLLKNTQVRIGSSFSTPDGYKMYQNNKEVNTELSFKDAIEKIGKYFEKFYKQPVNEHLMLLSVPKQKNDYDEKFKLAASQINEIFSSFEEKNEITRELNEAEIKTTKENIKIWEAGLNDLDLNSGKAIIKKDIFNGLKLNLVFSYILINDYKNAWEHYKSCKTFKGQSQELKKLRGELAGFFNDSQTKYIRNNENVDLDAIVEGKWKTSAIVLKKKLDLNKDGKATTDLLKEGDKCKLYEEYDYKASKQLIIHQGYKKDCKVDVQDDLFWLTTKSKIDERLYLITGYDEGFDPNDGKPLLIKAISYNKIIISTVLTIEDNRVDAEIYLTRIMEINN